MPDDEQGRKKMLRVKDVADRCDVSTDTVYRWINAGDLKAIRPSKRTTRIREEDLEEFLKRGTNQ